jgi:hypothetical protein
MLSPKNKTQNLLLWLGAVTVAVLLSFLSALVTQLPGQAPINWREIVLAVCNTLISIIPVVAAGLGLPKLGSEQPQTRVVLKPTYKGVDYNKLADAILKRKRLEDAKQSIRQ